MNNSIMKRYILGVFVLASIIYGGMLGAQEKFEFRYRTGDHFRATSEVTQAVHVDGIFSHSTRILNRIAIQVVDTQDGRGLLKGSFITTEESDTGDSFRIAGTHESSYWRNAQGKFDIEESFFYPTVRDVPVFPNRAIKQGDTWTSQGSAALDFREALGIESPFVYTFVARYTYLGERVYKGERHPAFRIQYDMDYSPEPILFDFVYPENISGSVSQIQYWNREKGRERGYEGEYEINLELNNGSTLSFSGVDAAEIIEADAIDREAVKQEIVEMLEEPEIVEMPKEPEVVEAISVEADDLGVTLSVNSLFFVADTAELVPGQDDTLNDITNVLRRYRNRDVIITGHTALAGTEEGRLKLSIDRAAAIADYFVNRGVRSRSEILSRGVGAAEPVATNNTAEGRRLNRRVEITILEN